MFMPRFTLLDSEGNDARGRPLRAREFLGWLWGSCSGPWRWSRGSRLAEAWPVVRVHLTSDTPADRAMEASWVTGSEESVQEGP
jgi:hypothetical protein